MYNRSTAIDHTVYRRYTQFVVSTTCYHILPYVATATTQPVLYILYRAVIISRAKGRCTFHAFVYNYTLLSHIFVRCTVLFAYCALFMRFLSMFLQLLCMVPRWYRWYTMGTVKDNTANTQHTLTRSNMVERVTPKTRGARV